MSAGLISRFGRCFLFATGKPHPSRQARLRGRRPLLCSAARCIVRNAKQKKAVPAKNSEANFWRPRFTWPLRAGKRANAHFACSEGFFLSGVPRHMAGWPFLRGQPLLCGLLRPVPRRVFPAAALAAVREACCNRVSAFCGVVFRPTRRLPLLRPACAAACLPCALRAQFCFVLAVCLPVPCWLHAHFSLIFYLLPFPA